MATAKGSHCALNTAAPAMRIAEGMYTPVMYCGASGPVGLAVCLVDMMVAVVDARFLCTVVVSKPHQARPHEVVGKQGIYSEANGSQLGIRGTIICITLGLHKHPTNTCLPDIVGIPAAESLPHKGQVFPRVRCNLTSSTSTAITVGWKKCIHRSGKPSRAVLEK